MNIKRIWIAGMLIVSILLTAQQGTASTMKYGFYQSPHIDTNFSAVAGGALSNGALGGVSWLLTRLEQHSSAKMVSYDDIINNNTGVDVIIFTGHDYINETEIWAITNYTVNHSAVLYNPYFMVKNETGVNRFQDSVPYQVFESLFGIHYINAVTPWYNTNDPALGYIKMLTQVGTLQNQSIINYPKVKYLYTHALPIRSNEAAGRVILANYTDINGVDSGSPAILFRTTGGHNYSIISNVGYNVYDDIELFYQLILYTAGDTDYNLNMFPNGKPLASYERFDDVMNVRIAQKLSSMQRVPFAFAVNSCDPCISSSINSTAWSIISANPHLIFDIGMHGSVHNYSYWNGSAGTTIAEYSSDLTNNSNYIYSKTGQYPTFFLAPGIVFSNNATEASAGTINGIDINMNLGFEMHYIWDDGGYERGAFSFQKYPRYNGSGYYDYYVMRPTYGSIKEDDTGNSLANRIHPDRLNLSNIIKSLIFQDLHNSNDYATDSDFNNSMDSEWTNGKLKDYDFYLDKPSNVLAYKFQRDNVSISAIGSNVTLVNNGVSTITGIGINDYNNTNILNATINGTQTNNIRWSNNITFTWIDSILSGDSKVIQINHGTPANYKLFIDFKGKISPRIGIISGFAYENNINSTSLISFSTNSLFKNASNNISIGWNNITAPFYDSENSLNTIIIPSSGSIIVNITALNATHITTTITNTTSGQTFNWSQGNDIFPITNDHTYQITRNGIAQQNVVASGGYANFTDIACCGIFDIATIVPIGNSLPPEVALWDANNDGIIQKSEAITAVLAYFAPNPTISKAITIKVVLAYFG